MKCQRCENEATVHEVTRKNGQTFERHLCESCARENGIAAQPQAPIEALLTHFATHPPVAPSAPSAAPQPSQARPATCPDCGMTFADFKHTGTFGCPTCYVTFEAPLSPLIERAHEGGLRHVGKSPRRLLSSGPLTAPAKGAPSPAVADKHELQQRLLVLRKQLEDSVKSEQYERAAKLRDEIRRLAPDSES